MLLPSSTARRFPSLLRPLRWTVTWMYIARNAVANGSTSPYSSREVFMNPPPLGRLAPVDLRNVWLNEASDFTPWLAREENLLVLGDVLGIDLELEAQEKPVGPFRADWS